MMTQSPHRSPVGVVLGVLGILTFLLHPSFASLATFNSLPSVLTSGNTIQLVVGFTTKVPSRVEFVGFRGCGDSYSCNQVAELNLFTSTGSSSYWRSNINYTAADYDGYCGGTIRAWYNDSAEPITEALVQGNRTFNVLLQRGIENIPTANLTSLSIDSQASTARAVLSLPDSSITVQKVSAVLKCGSTSSAADDRVIAFSSTSAFGVWSAQLPSAPQTVLCLMTSLAVTDSMNRSVQFSRLNRPYYSGPFPLTALAFNDETSVTAPFPPVFRVTAVLSADSSVGSEWTDAGVRISDCVSPPQDWYFGGVTGEFELTGKALNDLRSSRCAVTLLFRTDTQVETLAPAFVSSSLPSSFDVNIQQRAPSLVSLRVSPRVLQNYADSFSIDATLSGTGSSNFSIYAILSPADLLLPGDPEPSPVVLLPVQEDLDNGTPTSATWERRWRAEVRFAPIRGTRGGRVSKICAPYPFSKCMDVTDTVASSITLQQGVAFAAPSVAKFNFTRCVPTGTLFEVELEDLDTEIRTCDAAPVASIRTLRIFECDEYVEVPLRCISIKVEGEAGTHNHQNAVRVVYAPQRILHSSTATYNIPQVQDAMCSYVAPRSGTAQPARRNLAAVLGFTVSLLVLAIVATVAIWQRRRLRNLFRSNNGLSPSVSTSSIDSTDDRRDLMDRDDDMAL